MRDRRPISYYQPRKGAQIDFHKSKKRIRLLSGGNQPIPLTYEVLKADGTKVTMGQIKVEDKVFAADGSPTTVMDVIRPGVMDVYKIVLEDGAELEATENHCFYGYRSQKSKKTKIEVREIAKLKHCRLCYVEKLSFNGKVSFDPFEKRKIEYNSKVKKVEYVGKKEVGCINIQHKSHLFVLANGLITSNSGKTTSNIIEALWHALGTHPYRKIKVPNVGRIVTGSNFEDGIGQTLWPKFQEWIPMDSVKDIKYYSSGVVQRLDFINRSKIHFMSAKQDDDIFESSTIDWAAFDEPLRKAIYNATRRGLLKNKGPLWWSFTPLVEPWMYTDLFEAALNDDNPVMDAFFMTTWSNAISNGGYLPDEAIHEWEEDLSQEEKEARIYGRPRFLTGRIYPEFDRNTHVIDQMDYEYYWPHWEGFDPHLEKPHAWLQAVITPDEDLIIVDEMFEKKDVYTFTDKIWEKRFTKDKVKINVVDLMLDTPGKIKDWSREISPYTILRRKGIKATIPNKVNNKEDWIMAIAHMLETGKLKVLSHCTRTIKEFENYRRDKNQKIVKKYDDMLDLIGYIITMNPQFSYRPKIISYRRDDVYSG